MARLAIKAISRIHSDPVKDQLGSYKRGMPAMLFEDGHVWGGDEGLPKFVHLDITDGSAATVRHYLKQWERTLALTVDSSDPVTDIHTVTVTADSGVAMGGLGRLTKPQIETYLSKWNAIVQSFSQNSVTFTAGIWDALQSEKFWAGLDVALTELSYDQPSGGHQVQIDYSMVTLQFPHAGIAGTGPAGAPDTGTAVIGEMSGASALVDGVGDTQIFLSGVVGTFQAGERVQEVGNILKYITLWIDLSSVEAKRTTNVQNYIVEAGGTMVSNANNVAVAGFTRADVRTRFLADIRDEDENRLVSRRRWIIPAADMDAIVAAGGTVSRTLAQVQAVIHDRLTD